MRSLWWLAALLLLAGCSSPDTGPVADAEVAAVPADPWEGTTEQVVLDIANEEPTAFQLDVLCAFGGGVEMRRADGYVLNGSRSVDVTVSASVTGTGLQLGYVLTDDPQYDETTQKGITWLEPVRDGTRSFSLPVPAGGFEEPGEGRLWHFYARMNVPAEQDCYTGAMAGAYALHASAIKG